MGNLLCCTTGQGEKRKKESLPHESKRPKDATGSSESDGRERAEPETIKSWQVNSTPQRPVPVSGNSNDPLHSLRGIDDDTKDEIEGKSRRDENSEVVEEAIVPVKMINTGIRGNPFYITELHSEEVEISTKSTVTSTAVKSTVTSSTPSELPDNLEVFVEEKEVMISSERFQTGYRGNLGYLAEFKKSDVDTEPEAVTFSPTSLGSQPPTGDRNKELTAQGSDSEFVAEEEIIVSSAVSQTGSRGNPSYLAELQKSEEKNNNIGKDSKPTESKPEST